MCVGVGVKEAVITEAQYNEFSFLEIDSDEVMIKSPHTTLKKFGILGPRTDYF